MLNAPIAVRLSPELRERAEALGQKIDRPVSWIIRAALEEYLSREEKKDE